MNSIDLIKEIALEANWTTKSFNSIPNSQNNDWLTAMKRNKSCVLGFDTYTKRPFICHKSQEGRWDRPFYIELTSPDAIMLIKQHLNKPFVSEWEVTPHTPGPPLASYERLLHQARHALGKAKARKTRVDVV